MNPRIRRIIIVFAGLFLASVIFPPWVRTYNRNGPGGGHSKRPEGYSFIISPPSPSPMGGYYTEPKYVGIQIDVTRLLLQWAALAVIGTMCVMLSKESVSSKIAQPLAVAWFIGKLLLVAVLIGLGVGTISLLAVSLAGLR